MMTIPTIQRAHSTESTNCHPSKRRRVGSDEIDHIVQFKLDDLPTEVLKKIAAMADMPVAALQLTRRKINWSMAGNIKVAHFFKNRDIFASGKFHYLNLHKYPNLEGLKIGPLGSFDERFGHQFPLLINPFPLYPNLREIEIRNIALDGYFLQSLLRFDQLTALSLRSCAFISDVAMQNLFQNASAHQRFDHREVDFAEMDEVIHDKWPLKILQITEATNLTDAILQRFLAATPELEELKIEHNHGIQGYAFQHLLSKKLTALTICTDREGPDGDPDRKKLDFDSLAKLLTKSPELRSFSLDGNYDQPLFLPANRANLAKVYFNPNFLQLSFIDFGELQEVMDFGSSVQKLKLYSCRNVPSNIERLIGDAVKLTHIDLTYCCDMSNECIQYLTKKADHLKTIRVECAPKLSGQAWRLTNLSPVRDLYLGRDCDNEYTFNSSDFGDMIRRMPHLEHLFFNGPDFSANNNFGKLRGKLRNLKTLYINAFDDMTDSVFDDLVFDAKALEKVSLFHIKNLTDNALISLINRCPTLHELRINCPKIVRSSIDFAIRIANSRKQPQSIE